VKTVQLVVHAKREAHPCDPVLRAGRGRSSRSEDHGLGRRLGDAHRDRLAVAIVQQPFQYAVSPTSDAVQADSTRQPEREGRTHLYAQLNRIAQDESSL
jgi:hypothetical protein